ncbi:lantibiotic dehydratase C-terminal domain-containing protein [Parabacteroides johnsonii]
MNPIFDLNNLNVENYIGIYIHMTMNRLFRTENRLYELIIYDFMRRYYMSKCVLSNSKIK